MISFIVPQYLGGSTGGGGGSGGSGGSGGNGGNGGSDGNTGGDGNGSGGNIIFFWAWSIPLHRYQSF